MFVSRAHNAELTDCGTYQLAEICSNYSVFGNAYATPCEFMDMSECALAHAFKRVARGFATANEIKW